MRHRYPQPGNKDEFEDFCVRFYRHLLKRAGLVRYAKSGEEQDGIDIIDQLGMKPLFAIQCKNHEPTKTIRPNKIKDEVCRIESSPHQIDRYIIATTAKRSRNAHDAVIQLNLTKPESRSFTVEIHFWEDICARLDEFGRAIADFIVYGERADETLQDGLRLTAGGNLSCRIAEDTLDPASLFADINALFKGRKLEAAEHEISKLPDPEHDTTLSKGERYAILRLRAKLSLEKQQYDEGVRLFNLAFDTCPELSQAQQNRALALEFAGKHDEAFVEAARLINAGGRTSLLVSLLIRNAKVLDDLAQHQAVIDEFIASEEDVNLALADKYLKWDQFASADDAARRALGIAPESAHAFLACAMVAHHTGMNGDLALRTKRLEEAISWYSMALVAAKRDHYASLIPEIYSNRGRVRGFLGKREEAANDFRSAVSASDKPSLYAEAAASFFLHDEDYDSAWELVPILDSSSDEAAYLSAVAEYYHSPKEEKRGRIEAFLELADRDFDRATSVRYHCVQWSIELRDFKLARRCVTDKFVDRLPLQGNTLLAWIALEADDKQGASTFAGLALESSSRSAHQEEIAVLATILVRLGDDEKALPLLEHTAIPGVLDEHCKRLISCAQRLGRHDILLRICEQLRQTDQQDNLIRRLEVQLLSNYLPEKAFDLATEFCQFDESYFSMVRKFLAVRLGRLDQIQFDDGLLPRLDDFEPNEAYLVMTPYIETRRYRDALNFIYGQLRQHFGEHRAHGQYVWFVVQYGEKAGIPHQCRVVDNQSAIQLKNLRTGELRWLVIEDDRPDVARNEIASSTETAQSLIGKRVDEIVDLSTSSVQPQQEQLVEIQSKYTRAFQDAISEFQNRFPGVGTIQAIHFGADENFDPSPLIDSLKGRRDYVNEVTNLYLSKLCSIHFVADCLGLNERQVIIGLTDHDDWFVRCVECTPKEFDADVEAGLSAKKIVLDLSAIVTISRLDAWDYLDRDFDYFVSRATANTIGSWLHELNEGEGRASGHTFVSDDGKLILQDVTPEQIEEERGAVTSMAAKMKDLCQIKDSIAIAKLDPRKREKYLKVCGLQSLEAVSIAKDENALLWTDDLFVAFLGRLDFGVQRIWTQLAFRSFEKSGRLDSVAYSTLTAKLSAWNYVATVWHPQDLIAAGELCGWDARAWPLKQCVRVIGNCPVPLASKARLAMDFLRLLRRSNCLELKQSPIVQATLDAVANSNAVKWMLHHLDEFFKIDYPSAEFLKLEFMYWLRLR